MLVELTDPKSILLQILQKAYEYTDSPIPYLLNVKVTPELMNELVPKLETLTERYPLALWDELVSYYETKAETEEALQSRFIHFVTSMVHIFIPSVIPQSPRRQELVKDFAHNPSSPRRAELVRDFVETARSPRGTPRSGTDILVFAYIQPCIPSPYVILNVHTGSHVVSLLRCNGLVQRMFRVILHVTLNPRSDITMYKTAFDLHNGVSMPFSNGDAAQLSLRLDGERPMVHLIRPNPSVDCVYVIQINAKYWGTFHQTSDKLIVAVH